MDHSVLHIQMLGKFSLRWGDAELNDSDNRMKKVWLLLAYLICALIIPEKPDNTIIDAE